jgi:hypothetical protein
VRPCPRFVLAFGDRRLTQNSVNLTGVWHGLYSYDVTMAPVYFVASIVSGGTWITGTSHEAADGIAGKALTLFARLEGARGDAQIGFVKTYDGSGGWSHAVTYAGTLSPDATEIEGIWKVIQENGQPFTGRFLMIRSQGASEFLVRKVYEKA